MADEPVKQQNGKLTFRPVVAILIIFGSFATWYLVFMGKCPTEAEKLSLIIVGCQISLVTQIVQWYFGSSEGSAKKTDMMAERREP